MLEVRVMQHAEEKLELGSRRIMRNKLENVQKNKCRAVLISIKTLVYQRETESEKVHVCNK